MKLEIMNSNLLLILRINNIKNNTGHFDDLRRVEIDAANGVFDKVFIVQINKISTDLVIWRIHQILSQFRPTLTHIEWIFDILDFSDDLLEIFDELNLKFTTTSSLSFIYRSEKRSEHPDREKIEKIIQNKNCKAVLDWDGAYIKGQIGNLSKVHVLPNFQNLDFTDETLDCCNWFLDKHNLVIGLVGQLYSYRGLSLALRLGLMNPEVIVFLSGKFDSSSLSTVDRFLIYYLKKFNRLRLETEWIEESSDLNHKLRHLDILVIDTQRNRGTSGIAERAMAYNIPIVIPKFSSYLKDLSSEISMIHVLDSLRDLKGVPLTSSRRVNKKIAFDRNSQICAFRKAWQ